MAGNTLIAYKINEQEQFPSQERDLLANLKLDFRKAENEVKFLGLCPFNYTVSYYIGIDWLKENEQFILVHPKITGLDYIRMFIHCMSCPDISKHLGDIYHVDFSRVPITLDTEDWELTPFLIIHFLGLIEKIVKQGLKKNYTHKEENLNGKIKGKIRFSKHLKNNIFSQREDRVYCQYQDYSIDCLDNRLLKKTLIFIERYSSCYKEKYPELIIKQSSLIKAFEYVSDDISITEIKQVKCNPIYKEYTEATNVAKLILRRFSYSYSDISSVKDNKLPPFWIDMAKLFELYVYSKLKDVYGTAIEYQAHGKYGYVDFLHKDQQIIIDTKYKLCYSKERYKGDDIRQLSGYARDRGVLSKLNIKDKIDQNSAVVGCVIIAPDRESPRDFINRKLINDQFLIKQFTKFYWCGIRLPLK